MSLRLTAGKSDGKASSQTQKRAYRSLRLLRMDHVCCRASNVEKIYLGNPRMQGDPRADV